MKGYNLFYNRSLTGKATDKDWLNYIAYVSSESGTIIDELEIKDIIARLKEYELWGVSCLKSPTPTDYKIQQLFLSIGGKKLFNGAGSQRRDVITNLYSVKNLDCIGVERDVNFVTTPGNYGDCPEVALVPRIGEGLKPVIAVEKEMENIVTNVSTFVKSTGTTYSEENGFYKLTEASGDVNTLHLVARGTIYSVLETPVPATLTIEYNSSNLTKQRFMYFSSHYNARYMYLCIDLITHRVSARRIITGETITFWGTTRTVFSGNNLIGDNNYTIDIGAGWRRLTMTISDFRDATSRGFCCRMGEIASFSDTGLYYQGDGVQSIMIRNASIVSNGNANYPTLYIPTTTAAVTRPAPSPMIPDFLPETGSIAMIVNAVSDPTEIINIRLKPILTNLTIGAEKIFGIYLNKHLSRFELDIYDDYKVVGYCADLSNNWANYTRRTFAVVFSWNATHYFFHQIVKVGNDWKIYTSTNTYTKEGVMAADTLLGSADESLWIEGLQSSIYFLAITSTSQVLSTKTDASNMVKALSIGTINIEEIIDGDA